MVRSRATVATVRLVVALAVGVAVLGVLLSAVPSLDGGLGSELGDDPAVALETGAEFRQNASTACGNDAVELVHRGGSAVDPSALEFVVALPDSGARVRIVDLPVAGRTLGDEQVAGDGRIVYDNCVRGAIADGGHSWRPGGVVRFELNSGSTGAAIEPGDVVVVSVRHAPSGRAMATESVVAQ